ncbi:MAG TPA: N-acyl homoserine lactonase family protein [Solirubrobacteraceae bacterium]|nr:N-acyl homoserine lactonase family protein [Solirubrobacteraceae bacterium]
MKIEMFNVGWISSSAAVWRQGADPDGQIRFPIPAYLIETEDERILIDTGLNPGAVADPGSFYGRPEISGLFALELEQDITEQLDVDTLTRIVLTHLHFDHVGALTLLPSSIPIVAQRREWEAGHDAAAVERNFFYPRDYAVGDREVVLVDGDHDLLGDGSIELLLTPGHTPGHQSVRVGDRLILGVDVAHFASTFEDHRFPIFADDFAAQAQSADRLCGLRDAGAVVIPGHDPDVLRPGQFEL